MSKWNEMVVKTTLSWRDRLKILRTGTVEVRFSWISYDEGVTMNSSSLKVVDR